MVRVAMTKSTDELDAKQEVHCRDKVTLVVVKNFSPRSTFLTWPK